MKDRQESNTDMAELLNITLEYSVEQYTYNNCTTMLKLRHFLKH